MKKISHIIIIMIGAIHFSQAQSTVNAVNLGPFGKSDNIVNNGQIGSICFDPRYGTNNNETIYAASPWGGVWKSENDGDLWLPTNAELQLPTSTISDIVIHPNNPTGLFVSTGDRGDRPSSTIAELHRWRVNPIFTKGIWYSPDGGFTWRDVSQQLTPVLGLHPFIRDLQLDPADQNHLLTATSNGIYETFNATANNPSWSQTLSGPGHEEWRGIAFKPQSLSTPLNQRVVYASDKKVYRSLNGGSSWTDLSSSQIESRFDEVLRINIKTTPANADRVYAYALGRKNNKNVVYVFIYDNGQWNPIYFDDSSGATNAKDEKYLSFNVSPIDEKIVIIGYTKLAGTTDATITTNPSDNFLKTTFNKSDYYNEMIYQTGKVGIHPDIIAIEFSPNSSSPELWIGSDGGISIANNVYNIINTEDSQTSGVDYFPPSMFTAKVNGLSVKTPWAMGDDPSSDDFIGIGNQDTWSDIYHRELNDWVNDYAGDGYQARISSSYRSVHLKANPTNYTYLADSQNDDSRYTINTDNTAQMTEDVTTGEMIWCKNDEIRIFSFSKAQNKMVNYKISNDNSWSPIGHSAYNFREISQCTSNPKVIYASTGGELKFNYQTNTWERNCCGTSGDHYPLLLKTETKGCPNGNTSQGDCFFNISQNLRNAIDAAGFGSDLLQNDLPLVTSIQVHPNSPDTVWVGTWGPGLSAGVWQSNDGGLSFFNADPQGNLLKAPVNALAYQKGNGEDVIFAGTDFGLYVKQGNSPWTRYGTDLPRTRILDLSVNYCANKLRIATFGRGVWEADLIGTHQGFNQTVTITSEYDNQIIDHDYLVQGNFLLKDNVDMTVNGVVTLWPKSNFEIESNATLEINDGGIEMCRHCDPVDFTIAGELHLKNGAKFGTSQQFQMTIANGGSLIVDDLEDFCFRDGSYIELTGSNSTLQVGDKVFKGPTRIDDPAVITSNVHRTVYSPNNITTSGTINALDNTNYVGNEITLTSGFTASSRFQAQSEIGGCDITEYCYNESPLIFNISGLKRADRELGDYFADEKASFGDDENQIEAYPNPTTGSIKILSGNLDALELRDPSGYLLIQESKLEESPVLDLSKYPSGVYIIRCLQNGKWYSQKVILTN